MHTGSSLLMIALSPTNSASSIICCTVSLSAARRSSIATLVGGGGDRPIRRTSSFDGVRCVSGCSSTHTHRHSRTYTHRTHQVQYQHTHTHKSKSAKHNERNKKEFRQAHTLCTPAAVGRLAGRVSQHILTNLLKSPGTSRTPGLRSGKSIRYKHPSQKTSADALARVHLHAHTHTHTR